LLIVILRSVIFIVADIIFNVEHEGAQLLPVIVYCYFPLSPSAKGVVGLSELQFALVEDEVGLVELLFSTGHHSDLILFDVA
jgi:hypothetical protein